MNTPSQTLICNPEIEWSEPLSISFRPFHVSSHLPCLCECVRLIVKKCRLSCRMGKKEKKTHSVARIQTRPSPPAVSFVCRKLNQAAKLKQNTCARIVSSLNIMSRSRKPPFEKETPRTRLQIQIYVKINCIVNRANIFAEKIKVEGSVTFQNIFSSIMADFRAVVFVLPSARLIKARRISVAQWLRGKGWSTMSLRDVNKQRLRLQIDWHQKRAHFPV